MKKYIIQTVIGSKDEVRLIEGLEKYNIKYKEVPGAFITDYIYFRTKKDFWKRLKKELNLITTEVYCKSKDADLSLAD